MNKNYLVIVLDSCRYDTFEAANAPSMKALGELRCVHSFSCWTIPTVIGYLFSMPPIGLPDLTSDSEEDLKKRAEARIDHIEYAFLKGRSFLPTPKYRWAPTEFAKMDYCSILLSSNTMLDQINMISGGAFMRTFSVFKTYIEDTMEATPKIVKGLNDLIRGMDDETTSPEHWLHKPIFAFLLLMNTHTPYCWGSGAEGWHPEPEKNFNNQVKAIEYIDSIFPYLILPFQKRRNKTVVIVTSDHGDLLGPDYYSHAPSYKLRFDEDLFKIPYVRGEIG